MFHGGEFLRHGPQRRRDARRGGQAVEVRVRGAAGRVAGLVRQGISIGQRYLDLSLYPSAVVAQELFLQRPDDPLRGGTDLGTGLYSRGLTDATNDASVVIGGTPRRCSIRHETLTRTALGRTVHGVHVIPPGIGGEPCTVQSLCAYAAFELYVLLVAGGMELLTFQFGPYMIQYTSATRASQTESVFV